MKTKPIMAAQTILDIVVGKLPHWISTRPIESKGAMVQQLVYRGGIIGQVYIANETLVALDKQMVVGDNTPLHRLPKVRFHSNITTLDSTPPVLESAMHEFLMCGLAISDTVQPIHHESGYNGYSVRGTDDLDVHFMISGHLYALC